jgi:glutamate 5-kinase
VKTAVKLHKDGHKVIIVSSGAIGVGLQRMDIEKRPKSLAKKQVGYICLYFHIIH